MNTYPLNKDWKIDFDPAKPDSFRVYRADGRFFQIRFMKERWGQPIIEQTADAAGNTGYVVCFVRKTAVWQVAVARNERPCNRFAERLVEGVRYSASNPATKVSGSVTYFDCANHVDSARIEDKSRVGYVDLTSEPDESLPAGLEWMSFREFFKTSSDTMTKALLGQFMVEVLGVLN